MSSTNHIIGVSGKIGAGKTTLANSIHEVLPGRVAIVNFADALKMEVAEKYSVPLARFYDQDAKNAPISDDNPLTLGEALQQHGAMRRAEDPEYWLKQMDLTIQKLQKADVFVIGDVRHENEADWVHMRGGWLVRLNGDPEDVRKNSKRDLSHASETALDSYGGFDLIINTDTVDVRKMTGAVICVVF